VEPRASWASLWLLLPPGHGVAVPTIRAEMAEAGYRHVASHDFLPAHSFEVFAPAERSRRFGPAHAQLFRRTSASSLASPRQIRYLDYKRPNEARRGGT